MFSGPVQIAYAVDDVAAAAAEWADRGIGPFFVREHIAVERVRVDGMPSSFDHSSAYGQWGALMVELIHQHDGGASPIVGSSGVHHIACLVDDFAAASDELVRRGHAEVLYAETVTGMPFAFHDARSDRGHLLEIYEQVEPLRKFYDMVSDAAFDWDGRDPVRFL